MELPHTNIKLGVLFLIIALFIGIVIGHQTKSSGSKERIDSLVNHITKLNKDISFRDKKIVFLEARDTMYISLIRDLGKATIDLHNNLKKDQDKVDTYTILQLDTSIVNFYEHSNP